MGTKASAARATPVVREIRCRTILNRSRISDYSLNCYVGCEHGCVYCYARFMQRFHPHPEPWGEFVDVKVNAAQVLRRQLERARPGRVFVSSACDGWQPMERDRNLTGECCRLLLEKGFQVNVLTKSMLVLRDVGLWSGRKVRVGITVTTLDEKLRRLWEPRASSISERIAIIERARNAGLETAIMFGPLLPFLSDTQQAIDTLFAFAADYRIDTIWADALNPRPRVWPSVAGLLRQHFPELRERYSRLLFDRRERAHYLHLLRERVERAAARCGVKDRLCGCP